MEPRPSFCNPVNIAYAYRKGYRSRESADPCVLRHGDTYWLFASNAAGYWHSANLTDWHFIPCDLPELDKYAPAACVIGDTFYLTHSENGSIFKTKDPKSARWDYAGHPVDWQDPAFLVDDDGSVYCYYGCSDREPVRAVRLDPQNDLALLEGPVDVFFADKENHGFENPGDHNERKDMPCWLEGPWATKHDGKYYLQYAAPGTEFFSYADGCYIADKPFGPFVYAPNSPIAYKAGGFLPGSGHGSLVEDIHGQWWRFDTASISVNHKFERRLVMLPCRFAGGLLYTQSAFSDYPQLCPGAGETDFDTPRPLYHLLSYGAEGDSSSALPGQEAAKAFHGNIRSWWSAESGRAGEWLRGDLGKLCTVYAVHISFADQDAEDIQGRAYNGAYRYLLELSPDGEHWVVAAGTSQGGAVPDKTQDFSHVYIPLEKPLSARYVRLTNKGDVPAGGKFAVSGLRVFGQGGGKAPAAVEDFRVMRGGDGLSARLVWEPAEGAEGYIIRFGLHPGALYSHHQVIGEREALITVLNRGVGYSFTIDAYNDSGVTHGSVCKTI